MRLSLALSPCFLSVLLFLVAPPVGAEDAADVEAVVRDYLRVTDHGDRDAIGRAFAPDALLTSVDRQGGLQRMTLATWWDRVSRIPDRKPRRATIRILDIAGMSAAVRVEFEGSTDHLQLLKLAAGWRIVGKTLSVAL